jgi:DNA invertase Pin-like site-specific DNA recombinase
VSTDRQDLSPDAQRQAIESWARTNGITVVDWYFDQGVSGGSDIEDRPKLIAALADLKAHKAGVLVVAKRDRLARDTLVAQLIERAAARVGAEVVSADGIGNGDDPAAEMLRRIVDAVSAYERQVIRSRVKAALAIKKRRGERVGSIPYGWKLDTDGIHLVPVEREQVVIELAGQLRRRGATYRAIAAELDSLGHVSRASKTFDPQQVRRMLRAA